MKTIGFIGGGRITRILLQGFKTANVSFEKIHVFETNEMVINALKADYPQIQSSSTDTTMAALVVSFAPKITIDKMKSVLPNIPNLARMNPNAGTYVNKGYNPVTFATNADKTIVNGFIEVFGKVGKVPIVPENQIEAYAVISAMGHTYFWYQLQQLKELGQSYGLSEKEAQETISAMLWGTSETLFNSGLTYEKVVDLVPVKPMAEHENEVKEFYKTNLNGIYQKIKPT